jgi:hypothetical protein
MAKLQGVFPALNQYAMCYRRKSMTQANALDALSMIRPLTSGKPDRSF